MNPSTDTPSVDDFLQTNVSFDEAMQFGEKLQFDSAMRQEEIFNRVFKALESSGWDVC